MKNISNYLGKRTKTQLQIIKAITILLSENKKRFSADLISNKCNLTTEEMGGAFTSLTLENKDMPPLLLLAGRELEHDTEDKRHYTQYWITNPDVDWVSFKRYIDNYV